MDLRSPHTSYRWRGGMNHFRANHVYAAATHQLRMERREREIKRQSRDLRSPTPATGGEERAS